MGLEERARQAAKQAELDAARSRRRQERFAKRRYEEDKAQTIEAFQEHINQWAEKLEVQAPVLKEVEYKENPRHMEPIHHALASFTIEAIEFRAGFTMRQLPGRTYGARIEAPMYGLYVHLLKDKTSKYRIDSIQMLGRALKMPADLPRERSSHHYIDLSRAWLWQGDTSRALACVAEAERLAPQRTRYHPMARETVRKLLDMQRRIPEQLRIVAARMGLS
jgi:hypothetical protein